MRTRLLIPAAVLLALSVGACGGDDSSDDASGSSTTSPEATTTAGDGTGDAGGTSGAPEGVDACALADEAQVQALGVNATGEDESRPGGEGITWDTCRWGTLTDETGVVTVQVLTEGPDSVINPLDILLSSAGGEKVPTSVDVGTDGQLYEFALITGGGGVGRTIGFTADGDRTVAVSRTGEDVDVAALTALAQGVAANL
jgi:hypothetical protein